MSLKLTRRWFRFRADVAFGLNNAAAGPSVNAQIVVYEQQVTSQPNSKPGLDKQALDAMNITRFRIIELIIILGMGIALSAFGAGEKLPVLKAGSEVYSNVTVTTVSATDVYFTYDGGMANVKLKDLDPVWQRHFHFVPGKAQPEELFGKVHLKTTVAYILFWLGMVVWLVGDLMFLAVVFRYSLVWFWGCLFIPLLDWIYFLFNMKRTWKPTLIATVGCLLAEGGYWLGGFSFLR